MFRGPGTLYVFRIHQAFCANAVTKAGEAVLLRAGEPLAPSDMNPRGPGRLCQSLRLDRSFDGVSLCDSPVRILPRIGKIGPVVQGPRVGISRARSKPLRFYVAGSRWVSSPRQVVVSPAER